MHIYDLETILGFAGFMINKLGISLAFMEFIVEE